MTDKTLPTNNLDSIEESLQRLSKKPGVKAWIMLDRSNGAVLKTNGQVAAVRPPKAAAANPDTTQTSASPAIATTPTATTTTATATANGTDAAAAGSFAADPNAAVVNETQAAQELASMVWTFLSSAGSLVDEIDDEDELKLLRLRTRKQELVIVPEVKYLLVVVHDTPFA